MQKLTIVAFLASACTDGATVCDPSDLSDACTVVRPAENGPQDMMLIGAPTYENIAGRPSEDVQLEMIAAVIEGEPVGFVTNDPAERDAYAAQLVASYGIAQEVVDANLVDLPIEHTDLWFRDMGGVFVTVHGEDVATQAVVDFGFDGWGYGPYSDDYQNGLYAIDDLVSAELGDALGIPVIPSPLTTEGGAFQSNGAGTIAYSLQALLQRNPGWTQAEIEGELGRVLGATHFLALPTFHLFDGHAVLDGPIEVDGVYYQLPFTVRHADEVMQFVDARTIVVAQLDAADVSSPIEAQAKARLDEIWAYLAAATDQDGEPFELVPMPDPGFVTESMTADDPTWQFLGGLSGLAHYDPSGGQVVLPASYLNFVVTNDRVLVPKFYKEGRNPRIEQADEAARATLADQFAPRTVVPIDAENITVGGGGMHCITQEIRSL